MRDRNRVPRIARQIFCAQRAPCAPRAALQRTASLQTGHIPASHSCKPFANARKPAPWVFGDTQRGGVALGATRKRHAIAPSVESALQDPSGDNPARLQRLLAEWGRNKSPGAHGIGTSALAASHDILTPSLPLYQLHADNVCLRRLPLPRRGPRSGEFLPRLAYTWMSCLLLGYSVACGCVSGCNRARSSFGRARAQNVSATRAAPLIGVCAICHQAHTHTEQTRYLRAS